MLIFSNTTIPLCFRHPIFPVFKDSPRITLMIVGCEWIFRERLSSVLRYTPVFVPLSVFTRMKAKLSKGILDLKSL